MILCDRCGRLLKRGEVIVVEVSLEVKNSRELGYMVMEKVQLAPIHKGYTLCAECCNELHDKLGNLLEKFPEAFLAIKLGEKSEED